MSFAYLPLYTGDYLRDTQHLSMSEHGAYLKLIMYCWDQKGPAPLDERRLMGIVNARSTDEIEAMRRVLAEFFVRMDDGHYNTRLQREIERAGSISAARSEAGKLGYQAKAKQLPSNSLASAKQEPLSPSPYHTNTNPTKDKPATQVPARPAAETAPDCPHLEILALWAEKLPALPQHTPSLWRGTRADHLRARWRELAVEKGWRDQAAGLAYFGKFFEYIGKSRFLSGRAECRQGSRPFVAELEWIVRPTNWAKVHEGKYHPEVTA